MTGPPHDAPAGLGDGAEIVNIGEDTSLRATRQLLLEREGHRVASLCANDALKADYGRARIVFICHTLSEPARERVIAHITREAPQVRIVVLEKSPGHVVKSAPGVLVRVPHPRTIIEAARAACL